MLGSNSEAPWAGPQERVERMAYRKTRTAPTKPRRIHATEEEWADVKKKAAAAELSVSAYMVSQALNATDPGGDRARFHSVHLLTTIHVSLAEIADHAMRDLGDLEAVQVLLGLQTFSELLGDTTQNYSAQNPHPKSS